MVVQLLRLGIVVLGVLDATLGLPGTAALPGMGPRLYVAHLFVLAIFLVPHARELWNLALLTSMVLIGLIVRDVIFPVRLGLLPDDLLVLRIAAGVSVLVWIGSLWFVARYASRLRYRDRSEARTRDGLTGLFNQEFFHEKLAQLLSHSRRRNEGIGLLLIDLDRFKLLNDTLGHQEGDKFLSDLGDFLMGLDGKLFREDDYPCRIGGDEFAVIFTSVAGEAQLMELERRLIEAFDRFLLERPKLQALGVGVSVGSVVAQRGMTDAQMKAVADERMYATKHAHHAARDAYENRHLGSPPRSTP